MNTAIAMLSLHTSPLDAPGETKDAGGMNVYLRELSRQLGRHSINVDIFTRQTQPQQQMIVQLFPGVRVIHIPAGPLKRISKNDLYQYIPQFVQQIEAFRQQQDLNYELLHSHYWLSGVAGLHLTQKWDIPHVVSFHTIGRLKQLANPNAPEPALRLEMEQKLMQQADCIVAATGDERGHILRYCGVTASRVQVIPCGVDLALFTSKDRQQARLQLGLKPDQPMLLFTGRLDPFKGPDVFLRAASLMKEEAQVVVVGGSLSGDKDLQQLQRLAADLRIQERTHFLGAQPQSKLPQIYSAADITVVPSYHEIFGLVAVESLACGTPVVATRTGGLATIVQHGETGYLVPRCAGFFAERQDNLLADPQRLQQMQKAARSSVEQYSWSNIATQVQQLYRHLAEQNQRLAAL